MHGECFVGFEKVVTAGQNATFLWYFNLLLCVFTCKV